MSINILLSIGTRSVHKQGEWYSDCKHIYWLLYKIGTNLAFFSWTSIELLWFHILVIIFNNVRYHKWLLRIEATYQLWFIGIYTGLVSFVCIWFQAANYLNIKSLLDLTCQTVADMIKGKTPEEIRKTFNIKNDFTPEEEEEVRRENQWAFEWKGSK